MEGNVAAQAVATGLRQDVFNGTRSQLMVQGDGLICGVHWIGTRAKLACHFRGKGEERQRMKARDDQESRSSNKISSADLSPARNEASEFSE